MNRKWEIYAQFALGNEKIEKIKYKKEIFDAYTIRSEWASELRLRRARSAV